MQISKMKTRLKKDLEGAINLFPNINPIYSNIKNVKIFEAYLISKEDTEKLLIYSEKELRENSFHVFIFINPKKYLNKGCKIYDRDEYIDWSLIDYKDRHYNNATYENYGIELCTHIPQQTKDMKNPLLENLKTAYAMFVAYNKFLNGEKFNLRGYSHSDKGVYEYEQEKRASK